MSQIKSVEIRLGTSEDAQQIKAIETDSSRESLIESELAAKTVTVVQEDGIIVGYSVLNLSFFRKPTLELLMVASDRRRKGIGRKLLQNALSTVKAGDTLWTSTNQSNVPMQRLLEDEGFQKSGKVENLDPGDPEIVYCKQVVET